MNFYQLPDRLDEDIQKYEKFVKEYLTGTISSSEIKVHRVPMGIYEQRDIEHYMMRVRLPGGAITPEQLYNIAEIAEKYTSWPLHFTTRQDIQLHYLRLRDTVKILYELKNIGLSSRGGGGNTIRNIVGNYDSGLNDKDVFDIFPYVQALTNRMLNESDSWTLPRKFKIAFSSNSDDRGLATVNDLGFIAKKNDKDERGFSVYIAGGLGRESKIGLLLYSFIADDQVYNITKAVKNLFNQYGNRRNKHKARLRFLLAKHGKTQFIKLFEQELEKVKAQNYRPLKTNEVELLKKGRVEIPLFLGDIPSELAKQLSQIIALYGEDTIRISPKQNISIRNIDEGEIEPLKIKLKNPGILTATVPILGKAIACAGASTCKLGFCLSRNLLTAIKDECFKNNIDYSRISDIQLNISGCSNNCGQHIIADIGFLGTAKRNDNRAVPAYHLVLAGKVQEGNTRLAKKIATLPAKSIPKFIYDLLKYITKWRKDGENFSDFLNKTGKEYVLQLADKYSTIPEYEEDASYYYDWYSDKMFSLAEKIEGECSAGLFDLIELDLSKAQKGLERYVRLKDKNEISQTSKEIVLSCSRALLITKGVEAKNDEDIITLFKEHFLGKHIDISQTVVLDKYLNNEPISYNELLTLFNSVNELYHAMDDSLHFPETAPEIQKTQDKDNGRLFRDFRGVPCPMNFVKTKLVLETMKEREILEILIDDGEPIENVPASVKSEGHEIINQKVIDNYWQVVIKKHNSTNIWDKSNVR